MKLICIADTHKSHWDAKIPDGDILIHAGDSDIYSVEELNDFNNWLGSLPHKHKIVVAGNHDYFIYYNSITTEKLLTNAIYLENSSCKINGIKFWGSPITPTFLNWYFMADRGDAIKKYWDMIPDDTNILITHGPPYGILDKTSQENAGCLDLWDRIEKLSELKYHIFGHIHEGYGIKEQDGVTFINASLMNEDYELKNKPIQK